MLHEAGRFDRPRPAVNPVLDLVGNPSAGVVAGIPYQRHFVAGGAPLDLEVRRRGGGHPQVVRDDDRRRGELPVALHRRPVADVRASVALRVRRHRRPDRPDREKVVRAGPPRPHPVLLRVRLNVDRLRRVRRGRCPAGGPVDRPLLVGLAGEGDVRGRRDGGAGPCRDCRRDRDARGGPVVGPADGHRERSVPGGGVERPRGVRVRVLAGGAAALYPAAVGVVVVERPGRVTPERQPLRVVVRPPVLRPHVVGERDRRG